MIGARAAPRSRQDRADTGSSAPARDGLAGGDLYRRIGNFLADHRLSPDPCHYAFAFHVMRDADGPLGHAVARLTDGGVRLTREDIERLGGTVSTEVPPLETVASAAATAPATPGPDTARMDAPALVARTQQELEGFVTVMRLVQDEARGFGRDLAASAEAFQRSGDPLDMDDIVTLTQAMIDRVRATEHRLDSATQEVATLRERLKEAQGSARRDALTELPNRRAFEEAFAALDPNAPASLAICDVDWFKRINDGFGHAVGDRVLTAIGRDLADHCAPHLVARYGGEEFVVLLAGIDLGESRLLVDGARRMVAGRRFRARETHQPLGTITFSAGLGAVVPGETVEAAVARVDEALYRAKAGGRNQMMLAHA